MIRSFSDWNNFLQNIWLSFRNG